jgi:hypothetical protein
MPNLYSVDWVGQPVMRILAIFVRDHVGAIADAAEEDFRCFRSISVFDRAKSEAVRLVQPVSAFLACQSPD